MRGGAVLDKNTVETNWGIQKDTIITPIFTILEVVAELLVPFVIASLIDIGRSSGLHFGRIPHPA